MISDSEKNKRQKNFIKKQEKKALNDAQIKMYKSFGKMIDVLREKMKAIK